MFQLNTRLPEGTIISFHPFQGRPLFGHVLKAILCCLRSKQFPSLSGKTSIRTGSSERRNIQSHSSFPSLSGKTSIRTQQLLLARIEVPPDRFHPFQGRPLFGRVLGQILQALYEERFPSLSGKTSIRTSSSARTDGFTRLSFPSLSGKTSIRTIQEHPEGAIIIGYGFHPFQGRPLFGQVSKAEFPFNLMEGVSIPFREDLYSDQSK